MRIGELPFRERPVLELLHLGDEDRPDVDRTYAGYGWARVPRIHLTDDAGGPPRVVDDVLVLALHSSDVGEELPDDIELEFELPDGAAPVTVLASQFLEVWLPKLPSARAIVLAMCNPFHAALRRPETTALPAGVPLYVATGDVESWIEGDDTNRRDDVRLELLAHGSWATLTA